MIKGMKIESSNPEDREGRGAKSIEKYNEMRGLERDFFLYGSAESADVGSKGKVNVKGAEKEEKDFDISRDFFLADG